MIVGRTKEIEILNNALESSQAEMLMIVGRRGLGKKTLINSIYKDRIIFKQTGIQDATNEEQLLSFMKKIEQLQGVKSKPIKDWLEAFYRLQDALKPYLREDKKQVIFFDELSWLAVKGHRFLTYMGHFWNDWASRKNIILVISSSATTWMIQNVINNTGGLHNRVTKRIEFKPLNLLETEAYLKSKYLNFTRYQILQFFMAFGGVPLYLNEIKKEKNVIQNIDDICFKEDGFLKNEFNKLYSVIFENSESHIAIIRALAINEKGLNRKDIIKKAKVANGSSTTRILEELERSNFIMAYSPYKKKKKGKIYRLIDEYSLFYLRFIENKTSKRIVTFNQLKDKAEFKIWSDYAFEGICMKHLKQVKRALGIGGVFTSPHSFSKQATEYEKSIQIDLLIDRADQIIDLFEVKFQDTEFIFTKNDEEQLRKRLWAFQRLSKSNKHVRLIMITPFGVERNQYSIGRLDFSLTLDDLFLGNKDYFYF